MPSPARVPARVLAWLVAAEQIGELHKTLEPESLWYPPDELDGQRAEIDELLTVQGWRDRAGALEREVAASLAVLCRPTEEFYGWMERDGVVFGLLAGRISKEGVLAVSKPDGMIWISGIPSGRLAERLVAQLPEVPAGPGKPFTVSVADVRATSPSGRQRTASGVRVRRAAPRVRQAKQLLARPTTGCGELSVAVRDQWGHRTRVEHPLRYADTDLGRIANREITVAHGEPQIRIQPANRDDLAAVLHDMRRSLPA